ncbi:cell wall-binding repeat-containing protein [Candidatus Poriferisodalis sp.]|uniref:cell wall-binding repeat-containing protein n=1 Tax=Candidatus Poriferisodalis sp. TaxID=3101277 RepID=UPI003B0242AE
MRFGRGWVSVVAAAVLAVGAVPSVGAQSAAGGSSGGVVLVVVNGSSPADVGVAAGLVAGGVGDVVVAAESAGGLGEAAAGVVSAAGAVSGVVLVGGAAVLGDAVAAELGLLAPGVAAEHVSGPDRVATAAAAARRVLADRSDAAVGVVLADGWSLADVGVAAAVVAAAGEDVVLYSGAGSLPDQTQQVLADAQVREIVVVGGTAAVPDEVVDAAAAAADGAWTERVGGKDRIATAARAARRYTPDCAGAAVVANGWSHADVGTAAALAAALGDSVVLYGADTDGLGGDTRSALGRIRPQLAIVVGDTETLSDDIPSELAELGYPTTRVTDSAAAARYALGNELRNCRAATASTSGSGQGGSSTSGSGQGGSSTSGSGQGGSTTPDNDESDDSSSDDGSDSSTSSDDGSGDSTSSSSDESNSSGSGQGDSTTPDNDDTDDEVEVRLERARPYAYEGGDAVQIRVRLDSPPDEPVTIPLTAALRGGASPEDVSYSVEDLSFDFGVGETVKTFTVTAADDLEHDDGEHLVFSPDGLPPGFVRGSSVTIHLIDDDGPFSRRPGKDLKSLIAGKRPDDLWSDGTTLWVLGTDHGIYALDMDTLTRRQDDDITTLKHHLPLGVAISGLWSDGDTMWSAADSSPHYNVVAVDVDTGNRLPERDFALARTVEDWPPDPESVWSDGALMWVLDQVAHIVHAYDFDSGDHVSSRSINLYPQFRHVLDAKGIWSDGVTMWVSNRDQKRLYAYDLANGVRRGHLDFVNLERTGNAWPSGIWSDGRTMWVADTVSDRFYAYNMPTSATLRSLSVSGADLGVFQTGVFSYEGTAAAGTTSATVTATAAFADDATVTIAWEAADGTTGTGASATLSEGDNTITVTSSYDADGDADTDNADVRTYTVTVTVPPAADDNS